jgi:glycosyltransferase involved in cell wall biosynthesis
VAPEIPDVPKPPRILIAASRHPWPARRGDQIRALQIAEMLAAEHRVTLLVPEGEGPPEPVPFEIATYPPTTPRTAALGLVRALVGRAPLQSGLFRSPALGDALARLAPEHDLVILQLVRLAPYLDRVHSAGGRPVLIDLVDSLAVSTARRARLDLRALRPLLGLEARRLARWERLLVRKTAGALVVSGRDRGAIAAGLDPEEATRLHVVPVAVAPAETAGAAAPEPPGPPTLVLTGNLGYFPTREGLGWWLAEVWPRLRARRPELRLEVAGSRPGRALRRALARAGAELTEAPDDLAPFLRRATVALAPMRGGAGQPMKVVEAWAAGVPVVATPWTAAGPTGVPGEDQLVADDPEARCREILALVDDPARRARIAASARERLRRDYSPASVAARLREVVAGALASETARGA